MRKLYLLLIILFVIFTTSCSNSSNNNAASAPNLKDDFYEAVNYATFNSLQIPDDSSSFGTFDILSDRNYDTIQNLIVTTHASNPDVSNKDNYNIASLYETAYDFNARNAGGYGMLNEYITKIDSAANINELLKYSLECSKLLGASSLLYFDNTNDLNDATKYIYVVMNDTGIQKEMWLSSNTLFSDAYISYLKKMWELNGLSSNDASRLVDSVTAMMKDIAKYTLNTEDFFNPEFLNNRKTLADLSNMINNVLSVDDLKTIYNITNDSIEILIPNEQALIQIASYLKEENLQLLKDYIKTNFYATFARYTTLEQENAYIEYHKTTAGLKEYSLEKDINTSLHLFLEYEIGRKYLETYFSDDVKQDILTIIGEVKKIYKERLNNLAWMSAATKAKAITKLDSMKVYAGSYDIQQWPQDIVSYTYTNSANGGLFVNNIITRSSARSLYFINETAAGNNINENMIIEAPQTVNAFYSPAGNYIVILAGILQQPIYSIDSSMEEKLGGIGTIIAHEITHAFDTIGALYDENGNNVDWWQQSDKTEFEKLTQKVVEYYNSYKLNGTSINGSLTLGENIADLGALACITEYALKNNYNLNKIYTKYAQLWAEKIRPEALADQLLTDTHSPAKIRVNAVLSAIDEFYTTYNIKETDGMYKPKEERPSIW